MLRIAKLTDYATALMTQLAKAPERQVSAQQLSHELGVPLATVATLLKRLARAGLAQAARGAGGGYSLARPPADISVADIVVAIEGPVALTECALESGKCGLETTCVSRANWRLINHAVQVALASVSLADMAGPPTRAVSVQALRRHA